MFVKPVVFLGPSLPYSEAKAILDADYRSPLRAGDLESVDSQAVVGIIDGVLDSSRLPMAQAQKAINRGIKFFGAASTGALLASELGPSSMVGLGRVFGFLSRFTGNRETLITSHYAEHNNLLLTIPLINVVLAFAELPLEDGQWLARSLSRIPIESRSLDCINHHIIGLQPQLAGLRQLNAADLDAKANDARLLLHCLTVLTALQF